MIDRVVSRYFLLMVREIGQFDKCTPIFHFALVVRKVEYSIL